MVVGVGVLVVGGVIVLVGVGVVVEVLVRVEVAVGNGVSVTVALGVAVKNVANGVGGSVQEVTETKKTMKAINQHFKFMHIALAF